MRVADRKHGFQAVTSKRNASDLVACKWLRAPDLNQQSGSCWRVPVGRRAGEAQTQSSSSSSSVSPSKSSRTSSTKASTSAADSSPVTPSSRSCFTSRSMDRRSRASRLSAEANCSLTYAMPCSISACRAVSRSFLSRGSSSWARRSSTEACRSASDSLPSMACCASAT